MNETHVTNVHHKELNAYLAAVSDPSFVYYGVFVPHGDTEGGRLRKLGLVQVFKCPRPERIREVDKGAHHLMRKAGRKKPAKPFTE